MKRLLPLLALLLFCCTEKEQNKNISSKLDEFLSAQAKHFRFNGNVLVAEKGETILNKSYGFADFDTQRLLNDSSVFELASVSKQFTATGILLLKDKGKLKLTDSLRQYFPELPYHNITIWHLLTHTSGLPDYFDLVIAKWDHSKIAFNDDMIALLTKEKSPVLFVPGSKWEYSNTAYVLLASIIEKVSGQSFKEYMAENIFSPLQMTRSQIYNTRRSLKDSISNYAFGFVYNDSLKKYILPDRDPNQKFVIYMDGLQGDGIVNSTTSDLLKWDRSVKNHTLLKEETQEEMLKQHSLMDTINQIYYGYGVLLTKGDLGNMISHSGGWPGYATFLARNVDKDQTYVVLSNNASNSPAICLALQHIMAGNSVIMPYEHKAITLDSTQLNQFIGKYKIKGRDITLERKGAELFLVLDGTPHKLLPESSVKFFYADGSDKQIEFELDNSRKVKNSWFISIGVKTVAEKRD